MKFILLSPQVKLHNKVHNILDNKFFSEMDFSLCLVFVK